MNNPSLSIITINRNYANGLQKTIDSVINQTYSNFEYIIIDGGSVDGSLDLIQKNQSKLSFWVSEPDNGIYHAMNKGITNAKGNYCLFLNSGDFLNSYDSLEKIFGTHEYFEDLLICDCNISIQGKIIYTTQIGSEITFLNFFKNTIPHQSTFIKRQLFEKYGFYEESYKLYADYDFWLKTIIKYNCSVRKISYVLTDYNQEGLSSIQNSNYGEEFASILANFIPDRVIKDYEQWSVEKNQLFYFFWLREIPGLYHFLNKIIKIVYKIYYVFKKNS